MGRQVGVRPDQAAAEVHTLTEEIGIKRLILQKITFQGNIDELVNSFASSNFDFGTREVNFIPSLKLFLQSVGAVHIIIDEIARTLIWNLYFQL